MSSEIGVKYDSNKVAYHLLPVDALDEVARVFTFGAKKYGERNWEKGLAYSRLYRAAFHHMIAWWSGEKVDAESGMHPLAHAICCAMFILAMEKRGRYKFFDDRPTNADVVRDKYEEENPATAPRSMPACTDDEEVPK